MTTLYVRGTVGQDGTGGHDGTTPAKAWATIGYAVTHCSAGDTIWVGSYTYRVSAGIAPSSMASMTYLRGDTDGSHTGDAGEVLVTNRSSDTAASANVSSFYVNNANCWTVSGLSIENDAASSYAILMAGTSAVLVIEDCAIWSYYAAVVVSTSFGVIPALTLRRCWIYCLAQAVIGSVEIAAVNSSSGSGDVDLGIVIENCRIDSPGTYGIRVASSGSNTARKAGGVSVRNCTVSARNAVAYSGTFGSTTYPVSVRNSVILANIGLTGAAAGQMTEDYNVIRAGTALSNVTQGANTVINGSRNWRISLGHEASYGAPVRPFGEPVAGSPLLTFGQAPATYRAAVLATSPLAYWRLGEATPGTGTAVDEMGANNGTYVGSPTAATGLLTGAPNGAVVFGGGNYASTSLAISPASTGGMTIAAWVQPSTIAPGQGTIMATFLTGQGGWWLYRDGSVPYFRMHDATGSVVAFVYGLSELQAGVTSFVAMTIVDGVTATMYVNGAVSRLPITQVGTTPITPGGLRIGLRSDTAGPWSGAIDEPAVWNRALSAGEVASLYAAGRGPAGTVTTDIAGNPRPGSGAASVAGAVGAFERANSGTRDDAVYRTAAPSVKVAGPGFHEWDCAVSAAATTITAWVRWDGSYTGGKPSISVRQGGECGVADATATATGSAGAWEQLTLTFTPTAAGVVTLRFTSSDTSGAGSAWIDDDQVSP